MNALNSQDIIPNKPRLASPIKVALIGVTMVQQSLLEFYFATHDGAAKYTVTLVKDAEAFITNFDEQGATEAWENLYAYQNLPTLVLSDHNATKGNYLYITKPITPDSLSAAAITLHNLLDKNQPIIDELIDHEKIVLPPVQCPTESASTVEKASPEDQQQTEAISTDFPYFCPDKEKTVEFQKTEPTPHDETIDLSPFDDSSIDELLSLGLMEDIESVPATTEAKENDINPIDLSEFTLEESKDEELQSESQQQTEALSTDFPHFSPDKEKPVELRKTEPTPQDDPVDLSPFDDSSIDELLSLGLMEDIESVPATTETKENDINPIDLSEFTLEESKDKEQQPEDQQQTEALSTDFSHFNPNKETIAEPQKAKPTPQDKPVGLSAFDDSSIDELISLDLTKNIESVPATTETEENDTNPVDLSELTLEEPKDEKQQAEKPAIDNVSVNSARLEEPPEPTITTLDKPSIKKQSTPKEEPLKKVPLKEEVLLEIEALELVDPLLDDSHTELLSDNEMEDLLEEITQKSSKHTDSKTNEKDNFVNKIKDEERWDILCGYNEDKAYQDNTTIKTTFDPQKRLAHHIKSIINFTKNSQFWMELRYQELSIMIDPESKLIHSNLSTDDGDFIYICFHEINEEKIELIEVDDEQKQRVEHTTHQSKYSNEAFLWSTSLIGSHGLLPDNVDPEKPISIKNWLSLTKVEKFPHIMQIAAVFNQHHASLNETAVWMNIPKRYVYAFYNGISALDMVEVDATQSDKKKLISMMQTQTKKTFKNLFFKRY